MISAYDETKLNAARQAASKSPDTSRKTGCVIETQLGYQISACNTFPDGIAITDERLGRTAKYVFTEHAERNAIYAATKDGIATNLASMWLTWFPCADCARAIVQSGIKRLICFEPDWTEERYGFRDSETILKEGGVEIRFVQ